MSAQKGLILILQNFFESRIYVHCTKHKEGVDISMIKVSMSPEN
jgi:hypothetical protein